MCNRDSPVSDVSLHWWPRRDWSLWPRLRRASSRTVTRPSYRQCDNPTWSHTAFLSQFHARWSPFRLHNRWSRLLGGSPVESLQSHFILTMSHWSSGLPVCFPSQGTQVQIPWGVLKWNQDSPVSDVSLHTYIYHAHTPQYPPPPNTYLHTPHTYKLVYILNFFSWSLYLLYRYCFSLIPYLKF